MEQSFQQNSVRKDDPSFVYDKRVDFGYDKDDVNLNDSWDRDSSDNELVQQLEKPPQVEIQLALSDKILKEQEKQKPANLDRIVNNPVLSKEVLAQDDDDSYTQDEDYEF